MYAVEAHFGTRVALRAALLDEFAEGGVFVEGHYDVTSGSPLAVRVSAVGLAVGVVLDGVVQWRRVAGRANAGAAGAAPGLGVRLLPAERARFGFLGAWAGGHVEAAGRGEWRYPVEQRVLVTSASRTTGRLLHATLKDVGPHGARVASPTRLSPGEIVSVEVTVAGRAEPVGARVAWSTDDCAGLRVLLERREERLAWARVFESARALLAQRTLAPRRAPRTPSTPATPAGGGER